jgi:TonB-dependent receptor
MRYQQEEIFSNKLQGEYFFSGIGMGNQLNFELATSEATNVSDLRENLYGETAPGVFELLPGAAETGKIEYFDLADKVVNAGLSWTTFFSGESGNRYGSAKIGAAFTTRQREFDARRFRFVTSNSSQFDLTLLPEQLFTPENISPSGWEVRETTGENDAYDADHDIAAAYVMADYTIDRWRLIGGVRYEDSDQRVLTYNPFAPNTVDEAVNAKADLLPALSAVYGLAARTNLRFAASRTVNRPEFRELSPFAFTEVTGGRSIAGNPDLVQATIDSFDVRWETFPRDGEVVAISGFFKFIDQPIERFIQPTTELRTSFTNAESATLWGIELEYRQSLAWIAEPLHNWSANLNYAYSDSNVELGDLELSATTSSSRPLQGQSAHVGNAALQFFKPDWRTMARLLYNYTGSRISDVGAYGLPDIYEGGSGSLDLIWVQGFGGTLSGLEVKVAVRNLLDDSREFTQAGLIQRAYKPGRSLGLSLGYSFF